MKYHVFLERGFLNIKFSVWNNWIEMFSVVCSNIITTSEFSCKSWKAGESALLCFELWSLYLRLSTFVNNLYDKYKWDILVWKDYVFKPIDMFCCLIMHIHLRFNIISALSLKKYIFCFFLGIFFNIISYNITFFLSIGINGWLHQAA